jgi:hypothetical protein
MPNDVESSTYMKARSEETPPVGWLKLGVIAAASALAGGLAAAWWYRKTLTRLREAEENGTNPQYGIPGDDPADEG